MHALSDGSRPAFGSGGEVATLVEFLGYKREAVIGKALGLPEDAAHRPGVPSGTSLTWLVKHLTVAERFWFAGSAIDDMRTASALTGGDTVPDLVASYRRAGQESDAVIAGWTDLDQIVETPANGRPRCTARWIIQHMITETARHAGHADILREQIDGTVGR
ncbi:DinB family protein [Pseudonocardia lacus]|uniref:DinB family protein n=1 Tax=Pseudonocardia lacus TaxID=2835865 RepID=UPI001BDBEC21|nr:DinB family protein [Pseudonocardia lacus]